MSSRRRRHSNASSTSPIQLLADHLDPPPRPKSTPVHERPSQRRRLDTEPSPPPPPPRPTKPLPHKSRKQSDMNLNLSNPSLLPIQHTVSRPSQRKLYVIL